MNWICPNLLCPRWVGRQDSVGPAPPFFDSGGPQTGVWWTKMEGEEFTDDMKIELSQTKGEYHVICICT